MGFGQFFKEIFDFVRIIYNHIICISSHGSSGTPNPTTYSVWVAVKLSPPCVKEGGTRMRVGRIVILSEAEGS